jgi:hypothetical protein
MKKLIFLIIAALTCTAQVGAKPKNWSMSSGSKTKGIHQLSAGVRAGIVSNTASTENSTWNIGYQTALDLQYAYYFKRSSEHNPYLGILSGVSVGYISNTLNGSINDAYSTQDAAGDQIDYTITAAQINTTTSQVQLQVPVQFSLLYDGLFVNVGPKFTIPVHAPYTQQIEDVNIQAYYAPYGVTLNNQVITGKVSDEQLYSQGTWQAPTFMLDISLEIGYDFNLGSGHLLGVGAYIDYNVYNNFTPNTSAQSMINISQIGADPLNPAPNVEVLPMVSAYPSALNYLNAGIKVVYHFNLK